MTMMTMMMTTTTTTAMTIDELGIFFILGISFRIALVRSLSLSLSFFL
jgi:hypothetical protein